MLCSRCSAMFDRSATKAFEASKIQKSFKKMKETEIKEKQKQSISMTMIQFRGSIVRGSPTSLKQMFQHTSGFD